MAVHHLVVMGQGTRGDLYPLLGIARAVAERGHRVSVLEFDEYRDDVRDSGLPFVCVGTGSQCASVFARVPAGPVTARTEWLIGSLYFEASLDSAEQFVTAARRLSPAPDGLLAPANHVGAILTAELLGIPLVSVHLGPSVLQQVSRPAPAARAGTAPPRDAALIDRFVLPRIDRIRRAVGMPPAAPGTSFGAEPDRGGLLLSPGVLLRDEPPAPPGLDVAGYPDWFGRRPPPDAELEEFLAAPGPPVVLCSLGDGWARALPDRLRRLAAAAEAGKYRLLMLSGRIPGLTPGRRTRVTPAAGLRWLLPRADVAVHHGGMGTVVTALRCAVPSVTLAQWPDGRRNAAILARLGLGTDLGPGDGPEELVRALDDALADDARRERLRRVRDDLAREPDPASVLLGRLLSRPGSRPRAAPGVLTTKGAPDE